MRMRMREIRRMNQMLLQSQSDPHPDDVAHADAECASRAYNEGRKI